MEPTGLTEAETEVTLFAQMCYPGQNFDMSVPVPEGEQLDEVGLLDLAERFHDQHEPERGFCFRNQQPLVRGVRFVARGTTPKPDRASPSSAPSTDAAQARKGNRPAYFGVEFVDTPVYDGPALGPGATLAGSGAHRGAVHRRRRPARRHRAPRRPRQLRAHAFILKIPAGQPPDCEGLRRPSTAFLRLSGVCKALGMGDRMTEAEVRAFLMSDPPHTGKLATTRKDGSPHVAPIWYVLDDDGLIVFNTGAETLKGRTLRRDPRCAMCVDDERPPFSFVVV